MFETTIVSTTLFSTFFVLAYYLLISGYKKRLIVLDWRKLLFYISVFCLFGISGEIFVNTLYTYALDTPLWEYRLFPTHNGDISYFFIFIWGLLGFYKYVNDVAIHTFNKDQHVLPGIVMGIEAIFLELLYNGLFLLVFGSYIFYYFPENLGFLSHLSCLQVIPFYFVTGFFANELVNIQNKIGYTKSVYITIAFYWMCITAIFLL